MVSNDRPACARYFPANALVSFALCALLSIPVGVCATLLGTTVFHEYGWALFLGVPGVMGVLIPLLHGMGGRRGFLGLFLVNLTAQIILLFALLLLGIEGLGCLVMCAPLWSVASLIGTLVAYPVHVAMWSGYGPVTPRGFPVISLLLLAALPLWMGAEHTAPRDAEMRAVMTSVDIDAPPEVVWKHVLSFSELDQPSDWIFTLGVAYPVHATIDGHGIGAVRRCEFSTGAFVEPITTWDENHLLAFDVVSSPPSMREFNPFWDIHPPHLQGYLLSRHGQFKLIDLGSGRTRLEGTTWYQNKMFPAAYWNLWSDAIIHRIHTRVLYHIKTLSQQDAAMSSQAALDVEDSIAAHP